MLSHRISSGNYSEPRHWLLLPFESHPTQTTKKEQKNLFFFRGSEYWIRTVDWESFNVDFSQLA